MLLIMKSKIFGKYSQAQAASLVEERFRGAIIDAGNKFGVDPHLIAAILVDEISRIDLWDRLQDGVARRVIAAQGRRQRNLIKVWQLLCREEIGTQSFGLAQMNVNSLKDLIRKGLVELPEGSHPHCIEGVLGMLEDVDLVPMLVGAQIRYTIDHWGQADVDISDRPEICGTLYSIGLSGSRGVHAHPEPNPRGSQIAEMARKLKI